MQPTKELIEKTVAQIAEMYPNIHIEVIHSGRTKNVIGTITEYLKNPYPDAHLLVITQNALECIRYFDRKKGWDLIIDEIPQVERCFDEAVAKIGREITDAVSTCPQGSSYSLLVVQDFKKMREIAEIGDDCVGTAKIAPLANTLRSEHWHSYVLESQYQRFLSGK